MVKRAFHPLPAHGLADGGKIIAACTDLTAGLRVRPTRHIATVSIAIAVSVAITVSVVVTVSIVVTVSVVVIVTIAAIASAAELSVFIADVIVASRILLQRGINPLTIAGLAASAQYAPAHADVSAGLSERAVGAATLIARQIAVVVADVAPATVSMIEHRIMVMSVIVFAPGAQVVAAHANVFTALLVCSRRIVQRTSTGHSRPPKDDHHYNYPHER